MKPRPPVLVPGKTPWERLDNAVRSVLSVPKGKLLKEESKLKRQRATKRKRPKKQPA
jgi:hypothetical protein